MSPQFTAKKSLGTRIKENLGPLAVPVIVAAWFLRRVLKNKAKAKAAAAGQPASKGAAKEAPKTKQAPRRDFKVKRNMSPEEAEARQQQLQQQRANAAAMRLGGGGADMEGGAAGDSAEESAEGQENFFKMLQS